MATLKELRDKIDKIDADIIKKLAERDDLAIRIGKLKTKAKKKVRDKKREKSLAIRYAKLSARYQLKISFIKQIFKIIIAHSRGLQHGGKSK